MASKNHATERPLAILTRQMQALRTYYVKRGPGNLPTFGGLKNLTVFAKTKGHMKTDVTATDTWKRCLGPGVYEWNPTVG